MTSLDHNAEMLDQMKADYLKDTPIYQFKRKVDMVGRNTYVTTNVYERILQRLSYVIPRVIYGIRRALGRVGNG